MSVNPSTFHSADKLGENAKILKEHDFVVRVRYQETDGQGRVHHSIYPNYFETARVELLRASGVSYRDLENAGVNLVVTRLEVQYHQGAFFDDLLRIRTRVGRARGVRIDHDYEIYRDEDLIVVGTTTVAAVDAEGNVTRLPRWLRNFGRKMANS